MAFVGSVAARLGAFALALSGCASLASADEWPGAQSNGAAGGAGGAGGAGATGGCGGGCQSNGGAGATGAAPDAYSKIVQDLEPLGYWRLDELRENSAAMDHAGNHAGAYIGDVELGVPGLVGTPDTAAMLPGTSHIDVGNSFLFPGRATYTLEAWISPEAITGDHIIFDAWDGVGDGYRVTFTSTYVRFARSAGSEYVDCQTNDAPPVLQPSHVVATYDGENACLYLNGVNLDECGMSGVPSSPSVGSVRLGVAFHGVLDEVAIYGDPLSEEQVFAHYEMGTAAR